MDNPAKQSTGEANETQLRLVQPDRVAKADFAKVHIALARRALARSRVRRVRMPDGDPAVCEDDAVGLLAGEHTTAMGGSAPHPNDESHPPAVD